MSVLVYVVDIILDKSGKPILLGVCDSGRVALRVRDFCWTSYVCPPEDQGRTEDAAVTWQRRVLSSRLESLIVRPRVDVVRRGYLCGVQTPSWVCRLRHQSPRDMSNTSKHLQGMTQYNQNLDPVLMFLHEMGIRCFACVQVKSFQVARMPTTYCKTEYLVYCKEVKPDLENKFTPELKVLCFDLETDGLKAAAGDEIRMIGMHIETYPASDYKRSILLTRDRITEDNNLTYEIQVCEKEKELIEAFRKIMLNEQPVFVTGWNTAGFDIPFLRDRWKALTGEKPEIRRCAALDGFSVLRQSVEVETRSLATAAYGHNETVCFKGAAGVIHMDGLLLARKMQEKMQSYTLRVLAEWAGHAKDDVTYAEMVEAFSTRDPVLLRRVADYCVQDTRVVFPVLGRMEQPDQVVAMATLASVPVRYVIDRGEQVLTWSLIVEEATMRRGMMINNIVRDGKACLTYEGATVIPPRRGYYADPVVVLDFKSLYPSCMLAHNICLSTRVLTSRDAPEVLRTRYPEPEYAVIPIGGGRSVIFWQDGPVGVIPTVLRRLLDERQRFKKAMKSCESGTVRYSQLNARQLATKVRANSAYGFLGAPTSPVACMGAVDLAASVTSAGRLALQKTRDTIDELIKKGKIPADVFVVYGDTDSVMVCMPGAGLVKAEEIGTRISTIVTSCFREPMELEFETIMMPCLFLNKKRYAGNTTDKMIMKGISTRRRDYPLVVQNAVQAVLDALLKSTDGQGASRALEEFRACLQRLVDGVVPLDELIFIKELNKAEYKSGTPPPHVVVAQKIGARDPDVKPKAGDRIFFVIVQQGGPKANVGERAEEYRYAESNGLKADYGYYAELVSAQVLEILHTAALEKEGKALSQTLITRAKTLRGGQQALPWSSSIRAIKPVEYVKRRAPDNQEPFLKVPKKQALLSSFFKK